MLNKHCCEKYEVSHVDIRRETFQAVICTWLAWQEIVRRPGMEESIEQPGEQLERSSLGLEGIRRNKTL